MSKTNNNKRPKRASFALLDVLDCSESKNKRLKMSSVSVGTASVGEASVRTTSQPVDTGRYTARYYSLVNDVGGYVCRYILLRKCEPTYGNLTEFLDVERRTIITPMRNGQHIFTKKQIKKLFPDGYAASSAEEFDVSLSLSLLRTFIFNDKSSIAMWNRDLHKIHKTVTTAIADLARVRLYRNEFIHDFPDTSNSMTEKVFWSNWGDLTRIFLHLGKLYNIPDVYRKIDDLLHKPLDEARESELDNEIKLLREEVASSEKIDSLTGVVQTTDRNVCEMKEKVDDMHKRSPTIEEIEIKDDVPESIFKRTEQYEKAKATLMANKIIVLDGAPGEGKTTVAKKLVVEVSEVRPVQLMTTGDGEKYNYDKSDVDAVFIDDMFGAGVFDKEESRKWPKFWQKIERWVNSENKRYFVMTSRTYILEEARTNMFLGNTFNEKNVFTLSSSKLTSNEKVEILKNHFLNKERKHIKGKRAHDSLLRAISLLKFEPLGQSFSIGFPECTRLFANSKQLYDTGVEFFQKPMTHIMKSISEIIKKDDAFIAFFVLWAQTNRTLSQTDLERSVKDTSERIIDPIRQLQYPTEHFLRQIRGELHNHAHKEGFVEFDRMKEIYRFSHEVVRDAVGLVTCERNATAAIACCDAAFIENYVRFPSILTENVAETKQGDEESNNVCLSVPPSRFDQICLRITTLLIQDASGSEVNRDNYTLFKHKIFSNENFCRTFIKANKVRGSLKPLLTTKVRSIDASLLSYDFLDFDKIETDVRLPSFLLWQSKKLSELAKQCYSEMSQNEDEYDLHKELSVSLLIAASIGSLEIVQFLVDIGGRVTYNMLMIAYANCSNENDKGVLEFLKERIGLPNSEASDMTVESLFHFATNNRNIDLCDLLLKKKVLDGKKRTLFCYAVDTGKVKIVQTLLPIAQNYKVDMTPNDSQNTPLHIAIRISVKDPDEIRRNVCKTLSVSMCKTCTDNLNLKNSKGRTSLYLACIYNDTDIIRELKERKAHLAEENKTLLHAFVMTDKVEAITNLLTIGFNDTVTDTEGRTPLQFAVALGKTTAADVLRTFPRS